MRRLLLEKLEARYALASGELDPTFGDGGVVEAVVDVGLKSLDHPVRMLRQPDGKILVVGYSDTGHSPVFALSRLEADGSIDPAFGGGEMVRTPFAGDSRPSAFAMQSDGKILVASESGKFVRYQNNGDIDTTFGIHGTAVDMERVTIHSLAVQPDGKIVAAVSGAQTSTEYLIRFDANGQFDQSFGWRSIAPGGYDSQVSITVDGKILVATLYAGFDPIMGVYEKRLLVSRYSESGEQDPEFAEFGRFTLGLGDGKEGYSEDGLQLAAPSDGSVVVALLLSDGGKLKPGVIKITPDGTLDDAFGNAGISSPLAVEGRETSPTGLVVQADGSITLSGLDERESFEVSQYFASFLSDGSPDASWDGDGMAFRHVEGYQIVADIISQPDGGLLAAVAAYEYGSPDMLIVAYDGSGSVDTTFGFEGRTALDSGLPRLSARSPEVFSMADGGVLVSLEPSALGGKLLRRYQSDGELDLSFGDAGDLIPLSLVPDARWLVDAKSLAGGYILCLFRTDEQGVLLLRLKADGSLDTSFGDQGIARFADSDIHAHPTQLALDSSGRIVVTGYATDRSGESPLFTDAKPDLILRLKADGTRDAAYGVNGRVIQPLETDLREGPGGYSVVRPDGSVMLFRPLYDDQGQQQKVVVQRLTEQGTLDLQFGSGGYQYLTMKEDFHGDAIVFANGTIQLIGIEAADTVPYYDRISVHRFRSDGTPDHSYGIHSKATVDLQQMAYSRRGITTALADGSVIVAASFANWSTDRNYDVHVVQLDPTGAVDLDFGTRGVTRIAFHEFDDYLNAMLLTPDGLVIAATTQTGEATNLALARLQIELANSVWQNDTSPLNVDGDVANVIAPIDALLIINELNSRGSYQLDGMIDAESITKYLDVNGDYFVSPIDALIVINWLNANPPAAMVASSASAEGEADGAEERGAELETPGELDAEAIAWLMSSLETKEKRR